MEEQPVIKQVYDAYKAKGLEVVGISLDFNQNAWKAAIQKLQLTWPQLLDTKTENDGIKEAYHFIAIPYTVIIDHGGKIIAPGIPSVILKQFMSRLLDK